MPKKLPDEVHGEIVRLYVDERLGVSAIQRRLRVGTTTALRALERAGVERRRDTRAWSKSGGQRFDADVCKEIAAKYAAGAASAELQSEYDCCAAVIRRAVHQQGQRMRPVGGKLRTFQPDQIASIKSMWEGGMSQAAIGAALGGLHQTHISRVLNYYGIEKEHRRPRGEQHSLWKGGRHVTASGYVWVGVPHDSPFASMRNSSGYVQEHRLVLAQSLGRPLLPTETVHHVNGQKGDNRMENLELRQGRHGKHVAFCCADCGSRNVVPVTLT